MLLILLILLILRDWSHLSLTSGSRLPCLTVVYDDDGDGDGEGEGEEFDLVSVLTVLTAVTVVTVLRTNRTSLLQRKSQARSESRDRHAARLRP